MRTIVKGAGAVAVALMLAGCMMNGGAMRDDRMTGDKTMDKKDGSMMGKDDKMMEKK
jgi:hypothetical protein